MQIIRTAATHKDFQALVQQLDADLAVRDGEDHAFYHQFNESTNLPNTVVGYSNGVPVACGAFKPYDENSVEIKRMYTPPSERGKGYASQILASLEAWAIELGYQRCVLETGKKQPEAIALYQKQGYQTIPNYGQYQGVENSVCFQKIVS